MPAADNLNIYFIHSSVHYKTIINICSKKQFSWGNIKMLNHLFVHSSKLYNTHISCQIIS